MSCLYAFIEHTVLDEIAGLTAGWQKIAIWSDLDFKEKLFFLKFYGKDNLFLRFEYA